MRKLALAMVLILVITGGCIQYPGSGGTVASTSQQVPLITSFNASPSVITIGQSSTLMWNVTGATTVTMDPGIGTVATSGSLDVVPNSTTTYKLVASNNSGTATATDIVTVNPMSPPPVSTNFGVTPAMITAGQSATIHWNVIGADVVRIDPGIGNVSPSGSQLVSPGSTTTYILTATSAAGIINDSTTLSVTSYLPPDSTYLTYPVYPSYPNTENVPVIISFATSPPVISTGESAIITWDVSGADSVVIDQGIGPVPSAGSLTMTPNDTTYFTLTATNSIGSVNASAMITVYPINNYPTYPCLCPYPQYIPPFPPIRSTQPTPPAPPPPPKDKGTLPRIEHFDASPTYTDIGHPAQLQWNVNGATSVSIDHGIGAVPLSGTMTVVPNQTTVYKITASNATGVIQHTKEITVPRTMPTTGVSPTSDNRTKGGK